MKPKRWLWLLALVPILAGVARLRFDADVLDLLPSNVRTVEGLKLFQQHFANARELIITVQAPDAEQAESAARAIAEKLRAETNRVADVTWQPPWLEHPGQLGELLAYLWLNQPPEKFQHLTNSLTPEKLSALLSATREQMATSLSPQDIARASYDPFGLTRLPDDVAGAAPAFTQGQEMFSSGDGKFRLLFVQAARDLPGYRECEQFVNAVRQTADRALVSAGSNTVAVGYTGRPAFVAEIASGMQYDMTLSVGGTAVIIGCLFWLAHRRWKPMLWLLTLLALVLAGTLALGGLLLGTVNVVSMGFAAILLGLAVDYAVVHYQEALAHPDLTVPEIRRAIAPSIFWAAVTTISAFLVLNFGGLPGLGQLGTLVGIGVGLSACVMIFAFLPPLFPERMTRTGPHLQVEHISRHNQTRPSNTSRVAASKMTVALVATALLVLFALIVLRQGLPAMDPTANALRPRHSQAYGALDNIKTYLNQQREPLWLLVSGRDEAEVAHRLETLEAPLALAVSNHVLANFTLPTPLWPRPDHQAANRNPARELAARREALRQAASDNGFAPTALGLTENILDAWQAAAETPGVIWPTNQLSRWLLNKCVARTPTNWFAVGFLNPAGEPGQTNRLAELETALPRDDVWLSGWELLGRAILSSVNQNLWKLVLPMASLILLSLWLAFRRWREVALSLLVLALSGLCLLSVMRAAGWSWNLLNLMALPLIMGTGVDYSIFMQLALRRYHGDLQMAHRSVGRALLLCGATAIAGFGSLAWSTNAGMASLGAVCAVGIAGNMLLSVLLLPFWWQAIVPRNAIGASATN